MKETRKLNTILFADIVGYTSTMNSDETKAMGFLESFKSILEDEVPKFDGEIVQYFGDACLLAFDSATSGVKCAISIQKEFQKINLPIRIGMHLGEVIFTDNNAFGDGVNIASRIESMGVPGCVLVSNEIRSQIKNKSEFELVSLGSFEFKNVEDAMEIYALKNDGLSVPEKSKIQGKFKEPQNASNKLSQLNNSSTVKKLVGLGLALALLFFVINGVTNKTSKVENDNASVLENTSKPEDKSIAVLAFADMSPLKDQEYFSDGISEEILNLLTKIPDLKVISRTSSFSFKEQDITAQKIGESLNVKYILDGSIRKSGSTFRISTQLIETLTGVQLWSESYDRPMNDIFIIQDEIAAVISKQLKLSLLGETVTAKPVNLEAYNLYLEAKLLRDLRNAESNGIAEQNMYKAIELDSLYAPFWALMSELIYDGGFNYSRYSIDEAIAKGKKAALKSLELDDNYSLAYTALATFDRASWNFKSADKNLKKALLLDPDNVDVIYESASNALDLGRLNEALDFLHKAMKLDPVNDILRYTSGLYNLWIENYDVAEVEMKRYLQMNPNSGFGHNFLSQIYVAQGKNSEALKSLENDDDPYWSLYRKSIVYHAIGNKKAADEKLELFIEKYKDEGWPNIAHVHACRNEIDEAFKWLNLAFENKDPSLLEILNYPEFKVLYKDARWKEFIDKLDLPSIHNFYKK